MGRPPLGNAVRCAGCRLTARWCVCPAARLVAVPLAVDVLMHHREQFRPSSTGHLIGRILPAARLHLWRRERRVRPEEIRRPGRELWILHPQGHPPPADADPATIQAVMLDGVWSEAAGMLRDFAGGGRVVALPLRGESRFWLRTQQAGGRFSTVEALLGLLDLFGLTEARRTLALQFELHVYASLRVRGRNELAARFLASSPLATAFPDFLAALHTPRPLADPGLTPPGAPQGSAPTP